MRPTAYVLLCMALVLAASAVLLYLAPERFAAVSDGLPGGQAAVRGVLLLAAGGAAALGLAVIRYGGKGYTVTNTPDARR